MRKVGVAYCLLPDQVGGDWAEPQATGALPEISNSVLYLSYCHYIQQPHISRGRVKE